MSSIRCFLLTLLLCVPFDAVFAQRQSDFCRGFDEGWKAGRGEAAVIPVCPIEPITPIGSNSYREGLKSGMNKARKQGGSNTGGVSPQKTRKNDFCDGFAEGWKTIKGDLSIVPICPLAPITPLGSTPYREGLKAGVAKARSRELSR